MASYSVQYAGQSLAGRGIATVRVCLNSTARKAEFRPSVDSRVYPDDVCFDGLDRLWNFCVLTFSERFPGGWLRLAPLLVRAYGGIFVMSTGFVFVCSCMLTMLVVVAGYLDVVLGILKRVAAKR